MYMHTSINFYTLGYKLENRILANIQIANEYEKERTKLKTHDKLA